MDQFDLDVEKKNLVGGLDRLLVNVGLAFIALLPTYFYLIFRPKSLVYLLRGQEPDGRQGLKLGPGVTFILTILLLLGIGYLFKDVLNSDVNAADAEQVRGGIRSAMSEGNIWKSVILSLPLYFAALVYGVLFHLSHVILRKKSNLNEAVGVGLYTLSTMLFLIIPIGMISDSYGTQSAYMGTLVGFFAISLLLILPWQTFSFSKNAFANSTGSAAAVALVFFVVVFVSFTIFGVVVSFLNNAAENLGS